jgi:hypothetical protein
MKAMIQTVIQKEQKAAIAAMLASGYITNEVATQLMDKLNAELLNSNLI